MVSPLVLRFLFPILLYVLTLLAIATLIPLCAYLRSCFGTCTGISFIDSTCLRVCWAGNPPSSNNRRINQHRVFKDIAARGKTSMEWFFGLKLDLVINDKGELLNFQVTPCNVADRKPVPDLLQHFLAKCLLIRVTFAKKCLRN